MDFLDFALIAEGAAAAFVLVRAWRKTRAAGEPEGAPEGEETAGPRADLLEALAGALAALKRKGYKSGPEILQLSALIEKVREGDQRATPALAVFCLEKFPEKIAGAYIRKIQNIKF